MNRCIKAAAAGAAVSACSAAGAGAATIAASSAPASIGGGSGFALHAAPGAVHVLAVAHQPRYAAERPAPARARRASAAADLPDSRLLRGLAALSVQPSLPLAGVALLGLLLLSRRRSG